MGCELAGNTSTGPDYGAITDIRYTQHVQPFLDQKCTACHGGATAEAGLRLDSWAHVTAGSDFGEAIIPFDAAHSRLIELAAKRNPPHPAAVGGPRLTQEEIDFLARWIDGGARNDAGEVPFESASALLYVCNQDDASISVVDMTQHVVIRRIDLQALGFSPNARPHHAAVAPDGAHWYVSLIGENKVLQFDSQNRLVGTADFETPGMLAVHPTDDLLYVGRSMTAVNPPPSIGVFRQSDLAPVAVIDVLFPRPHALVVDPDGRYVYTASLSQNALLAAAAPAGPVAATLLEAPPQAFVQYAAAPDGATLYVTSQLTGQVHVLDAAGAPSLALLGSISVGPQPWHPVFTPDGRSVYLGNKGVNTVTVIDAAEWKVATVIEGAGLAEPHGSAVRPDGRYVYISNNNAKGTYAPRHDLGDNAQGGTVVVIDTETDAIVKVLEVEANPTGLGATP